MDNKPVRNPRALEHLNNAVAYLTLALVEFEQKDQTEQAKAADVLLDTAITLRKQVTK